MTRIKRSFLTVASAEAYVGVDNETCYVIETETEYRYKSASSFVVNHASVLSTGEGDTAKWLGVSGKCPVPLWDDIIITEWTLGNGVAAPDLVGFGPIQNMRMYSFDGDSITERLFAVCEMPHTWEEGTSIYPHVHWSPTTASSGNAKWWLDLSYANLGDVFSSVYTLTSTDAATGQWKNTLSAFGPITLDGLKLGGLIAMSLYRIPTDTSDTYPNDAMLLSFGLHILHNTMGSTQIASK